MKRLIKSLALVAVIIAANTACENDANVDTYLVDNTNNPQSGYQITLDALIDIDLSRSIISDDGTDLTFAWESTDNLYAIIKTPDSGYIKFNNDTQDYATIGVTPDSETSSKATLKFEDLTTAESIPAGSTLYLCTKQSGSSSPVGVAIPYTFTYPITTTGTSNLGDSHIVSSSYSIVDAIDIANGEGISAQLNFNHLTTTVRFGIYNSSSSDIQVDSFSVVANSELGISTSLTNSLGEYSYGDPVADNTLVSIEEPFEVTAGETKSFYVNFVLGEYNSVVEDIFTIEINGTTKSFTSTMLDGSDWNSEMLERGVCYDIDYKLQQTTFDLDAISGNTLEEKLTTAGFNVDSGAAVNDLLSFTNLTLTSSSYPLSSDDYTLIANMKSMENLDLSSCQSSVTAVPSYWIRYRDCLKTVKLPASIKDIYAGAFMGCPNLTYVSTENITNKISQNAFSSCTKLNNLDLSNVLTIDYEAFKGCEMLESIDLSSVSTVTANSFENCKSLESVTLKSGSTIATYAFSGCESLKTINNMNTVTAIATYSFSGCSSLESIDLSSLTTINGQAFLGCTSLSNITFNPSATVGLATYAFSGCTSLTNIDLSQITSVGNSSFLGCTELSRVDLRDDVTLSSYAFSGCSSLSEINISAIKSIGTYSFQDCTSLKTIDSFHSNITTISNYAFQNCSQLESVDLSNITSVGTSSFSGCSKLTVANNGDLTSLTTELGASAFANCTSLTTITLSDYIAAIDHFKSGVFEGCSSLSSINMPTNIKQIYGSAFKGCVKLTSVSLPSTITTLSASCFEGTGLTSVEIKDSGTAITLGDLAFGNCPDLTTLTIHSVDMVKVGETATTSPIYGSNSIANIYVPSTLVDTYKTAVVFANYADLISAIID